MGDGAARPARPRGRGRHRLVRWSSFPSQVLGRYLCSTSDGVVCSTWRAHRLLLLAWKKGGSAPQMRLLDALYAAAFERGEDIGDVDTLAGLAESTGLVPRDEASRCGAFSFRADRPRRQSHSSNPTNSRRRSRVWSPVPSGTASAAYPWRSLTAAGRSAAARQQTCFTRCVPSRPSRPSSRPAALPRSSRNAHKAKNPKTIILFLHTNMYIVKM